MIFRTALAALLVSAIANVAPAQQDSADAIETVIRDQIADFRADDLAGAFEHASPSIQGIFGTPEVFGQMVRNGYPMVWRPGELRFGRPKEQPDRVVQPVIVFDLSGVPHALEYELILLKDSWKINGVRLLQADTGA